MPDIETPAVIAVLVTYNRSDILQKALDCVQKQRLSVKEIVVVDNNSADNTQAVLAMRKSQDARIIALRNEENAGYGGGLHTGMEWVLANRNPDFLWLMDDDSFPEPDALALLLDYAGKTDYDLIGLSGYEMRYWSKKTVFPETHTDQVEFVLVDNAIVSIKAARVAGVVSSEFFMMCEDYEYCLRLRKNGFRIGLINNHHVQRLNLGSQKFSRTTLWRGYYHSRNHMLILKDYFTFKRLFHYLIIQIKYLSASILAPDRMLRLKLRLTGLIHGIKQIKGKTLDPATLQFVKRFK